MRPRWGEHGKTLGAKGSRPRPRKRTLSCSLLMQASASAGESPAQLKGPVALARSTGKNRPRSPGSTHSLPETRGGLERAGLPCCGIGFRP